MRLIWEHFTPRLYKDFAGTQKMRYQQIACCVAFYNSSQSNVAATSCNSEVASGDQAMKQQYGERQASLKPAKDLVQLHLIQIQF